MARRGRNSFRRNDGIRALRVARDGGLDPSALEIVVGPDGAVTFRVYGEKGGRADGSGTGDRRRRARVAGRDRQAQGQGAPSSRTTSGLAPQDSRHLYGKAIIERR